MISALGFVVAALAVARITRLITADYITSVPRAWLVNRLGVDSHGAYLLTCPWCMSVWVALPAGAALCWWWDVTLWWTPVIALALSQVTGLLARGEDE